MGNRYVQSGEKKKICYVDANNLYGRAMSEYLPYDEINFDKIAKLEDFLNTPDNSDIGYFFEIDMICPDILKNTKKFPFAHENQKELLMVILVII